METPKVIYLQTCGDCAGLDCATCNFDNLDEVTWCKDKINDSDTAYFSEEAVRKAVSRLIIGINSDLFLQGVKSQLNTKVSVENVISQLKGESQ